VSGCDAVPRGDGELRDRMRERAGAEHRSLEVQRLARRMRWDHDRVLAALIQNAAVICIVSASGLRNAMLSIVRSSYAFLICITVVPRVHR
jgi:hypothetical protein